MTELITLLICYLSVSLTNAIHLTIPGLGNVRGGITASAWNNRTIYQFLGLRYAQPPSGPRRFLAPEPITPWNVYDATKHGRVCPDINLFSRSISSIDPKPSEDIEDCLTLDVYTPINPENNSALLPVMVFIHGGGYVEGSSKMYLSNYLLEHDVLLVVPQYRLGPLGFLSLHTDGMPGNAGLLDQVLALHWVHKHIGAFGGDNKRVTLFGHSAGGASVTLHLLSPLVEPHLFQRAIVQSASAFAPWIIEHDPVTHARKIYKELVEDSQIAELSEMETAFKSASLHELFRATHSSFIKEDPENHRMNRGLVARLVVQKAGKLKFLTKTPERHLIEGDYRTVPMMAGVSRNEGVSLIFGLRTLHANHANDDYLRNNLTSYYLKIVEIEDDSGAVVDVVTNKYLKKKFALDKNLIYYDIAPEMADIMGTFIIKGQLFKQAKVNAKRDDTYLYTFDYSGKKTSFEMMRNKSLYPYRDEVTHGDDLLYLFPHQNRFLTDEEDVRVAKLTSKLWTNFAITGKPMSSEIGSDWPLLKKNKNGPYIHIDRNIRVDDDFVENEYQKT